MNNQGCLRLGQSGTAKDQIHEASLDRRGGNRCACDLRASFGATGNSSGGAQTPYTTGAPPAPTPSGRMPAGGRNTSGERIPPILPSASDTTSATPCGAQSRARPPRDARSYGPWPEIGDGCDLPAEPSRARPPAGWAPLDGLADGSAPTSNERREQHGNARSERGRARSDPL
jgi:hypothetical protein